MDVAARLDAIEQENERLRDRIAQLEGLLFEQERLPVELHLTPHEERLVSFLLKRNEASKEAILTALYGTQPDDDPEIKIVDVFVCTARKKLAGFGIKIETLRGRGYVLPAASKAALRAMRPVQTSQREGLQ